MASYRGQFTQSKMRPCLREGKRREWRFNEVKCTVGNPSWALAWQEVSLASY